MTVTLALPQAKFEQEVERRAELIHNHEMDRRRGRAAASVIEARLSNYNAGAPSVVFRFLGQPPPSVHVSRPAARSRYTVVLPLSHATAVTPSSELARPSEFHIRSCVDDIPVAS